MSPQTPLVCILLQMPSQTEHTQIMLFAFYLSFPLSFYIDCPQLSSTSLTKLTLLIGHWIFNIWIRFRESQQEDGNFCLLARNVCSVVNNTTYFSVKISYKCEQKIYVCRIQYLIVSCVWNDVANRITKVEEPYFPHRWSETSQTWPH